MKIWREKAGVISVGPCWIVTYGSWMHCCPGIASLLWSLLTEWKSDQHLVG